MISILRYVVSVVFVYLLGSLPSPVTGTGQELRDLLRAIFDERYSIPKFFEVEIL
jgi:hypothetical protein